MQAVLRTGLYVAAVLIPLQIVVGDLHGLNTLEHQPAKMAAMEGIWETQKGAPAVLFALPGQGHADQPLRDRDPQAGVALPHARLEWRDQGHQGLWRQAPAGGAGVLGLSHHGRRGHADAGRELAGQSGRCAGTQLQPWLARVLVAMTFAGWVALIAGWYVTEIGRQPWLVQGVLTAAQAASTVPGQQYCLDAGDVPDAVRRAARVLCAVCCFIWRARPAAHEPVA